MTQHNDGGPAFPPMHNPETHVSGMSLRDYFAGQALAIVYSRFEPHADPDPQDIATQAYFIADAMIEERKVQP